MYINDLLVGIIAHPRDAIAELLQVVAVAERIDVNISCAMTGINTMGVSSVTTLKINKLNTDNLNYSKQKLKSVHLCTFRCVLACFFEKLI